MQYKTAVPASVYGIQKYLGSGLIKGIGPIMAKRIVKKFGKETLEVIESDIEKLADDKRIVIEDLNEDIAENNKAVYLAKFHLSETRIATRLKTLVNAPKSIRNIALDKAIEWVQKQLAITLAERQVEAVKCAVKNKVMVITGGPGTGKTTIINAILKIFSKLRVNIMLAAPTGRAAKRMSEATGHEAKTIHRMLEYSIQKGGFQKNDEYPLDCDVLIVDEASMIDTIDAPSPEGHPSRSYVHPCGGCKPTPICWGWKCSQGYYRIRCNTSHGAK